MLDNDLKFYLREYKFILESIRDSLRSIANFFEKITENIEYDDLPTWPL